MNTKRSQFLTELNPVSGISFQHSNKQIFKIFRRLIGNTKTKARKKANKWSTTTEKVSLVFEKTEIFNLLRWNGFVLLIKPLQFLRSGSLWKYFYIKLWALPWLQLSSVANTSGGRGELRGGGELGGVYGELLGGGWIWDSIMSPSDFFVAANCVSFCLNALMVAK